MLSLRSWLTVLPLLVALVLTACGSQAPTPAAQSATAPVAGATTDVANTPATLTLFGGAGLSNLYNALATAFHAKYPAITVTVKTEADNNYNTVLPRQLASDNAPDLAAYVNLLRSVKDGLLTNLDGYARQYGWAAKIPASILDSGRVSDQGVRGSGALYMAGGSAGSAVGVFYNKELAAKIGLTDPPKSVAELEAALAKAKAAGITPIIASNKDGLILHLQHLLMGNYMGAKATNDFIYHVSGATINNPEAIAANAILQKWMQASYFNADANAVDQQASYGKFAGGEGLFMFQGSWLVPVLDKSFAGKYGFFPMPPKDAGSKYTAMSGHDLMFAIPTKAKNKDAAALFLDWLTTPEAAQVAVKNGYQVAGTTTDTPAPAPLSGTLSEQLQAEYSLVAANDGFHSWQIDASPSLGPVWTSELQLLFAGKTTPEELLAKLQSTYDADLAKK